MRLFRTSSRPLLLPSLSDEAANSLLNRQTKKKLHMGFLACCAG